MFVESPTPSTRLFVFGVMRIVKLSCERHIAVETCRAAFCLKLELGARSSSPQKTGGRFFANLLAAF